MKIPDDIGNVKTRKKGEMTDGGILGESFL